MRRNSIGAARFGLPNARLSLALGGHGVRNDCGGRAMNVLRLPPPDWWRPGLTEEGAKWRAAHHAGQLPDSWEAAGFKPARATFDRVVVDYAGRIIILAGRHEWFSRRRPKPFIVGERHTLYEIAMGLDDRHPYSVLFSCGAGTGVEDDERGDLRRAAIALSDKSQKIYDMIIEARRIIKARRARIKPLPTSWREPADDTLWVFNVTDVIEIIFDELAGHLAALGDGGVIGALRDQRDTAKAERERQTVSEDVMAAPREAADGGIAEPLTEHQPQPRRQYGPAPTEDKIREAGKALIADGTSQQKQ